MKEKDIHLRHRKRRDTYQNDDGGTLIKFTAAQIRKTGNSVPLGIIRIIAGLALTFAGIFKLFAPTLEGEWSRQLIQSGVPFRSLIFYGVPYLEIVAGALLTIGYCARLWALVLAGLMLAATYVHLAVEDPSLFPLQPHFPVVPLAMFAFAVYVIMRGAGAWSMDRRTMS